MATLLELSDQEALFRFDPALGRLEFEERCIYFLPRARNWMAQTLPVMSSSWDVETPPDEQLDALLYEFCVGEPLEVGRRFKSLVHLGSGVWQLKTADIRLFGWFARKDCFIVSSAGDAGQVKAHHLYYGHCQQAVQSREALELDEPKFIAGDSPDDVVSNCY